MDATPDDEHFAWSIVLSNVKNGRRLKPFNISTWIQLCLDFKIIFSVKFILMYALHKTSPIYVINAGKIFTHCLEFNGFA